MFLTAIGFTIGGLIALFLKEFHKRISIIYSLCTGYILGLIVFDIAPSSIEQGNTRIFLLGLLIGAILFSFLHEEVHSFTRNQVKQNPYLNTALLLALSISIHNFPVGIAMGSNEAMGHNNSMIYLLILHNIPEGVALITPLLLGEIRARTWLTITCIILIPVGIGILLGSSLEYFFPPSFWALVLSFAIGIMLSVTIKEMLFVAIKKSSAIVCIAYAILGFILMWIYLQII
ncbi:ZIP family metal transporter [Ureibacillus sp. NPDC094379]